MKPNVHLHIDHLVLNGFEHLDQVDVGAAVQTELTRLLSEQGAPQSLLSNARVSLIDAGQFNATREGRSDIVGGQIAQSIYGGLKP